MNKVRGEARQFAAEFLPLVAAVKRVESLVMPALHLPGCDAISPG